MDFFDKIGNIASKTTKKTGDIAKEAKIKMKMSENKSKISDLYEEIGKIVYQKHIHGMEVKIKEDLSEYCNQIDELSKEVEKYQEEVLAIRNKRICENCYAEIELNSKYCPHCGFEQAEEKVEDIKEETPVQPEEKDVVEIVEENKEEE